VHNDELLSRITEHDIGLALDPRNPLNREVTVTNKILQYLLGGLTVIASNTAGHTEVAEQARGAVTLYQSGNAEDLACCLDTLIADKKARVQTRRAALEAAQQTFCWEQFSKHLANIVRRIEL
jgi:glycosyltransferase involved in cell wall biosynthesis